MSEVRVRVHACVDGLKRRMRLPLQLSQCLAPQPSEWAKREKDGGVVHTYGTHTYTQRDYINTYVHVGVAE